MDKFRIVLIIVGVLFLISCATVPIHSEKDPFSHSRYFLGRFCQDVSIAISAFLGWNATGVRGLCPCGLIGVIVGKALNRFLDQDSYDIILPGIITVIAANLNRNQQLYAVASFAAWWLFFARNFRFLMDIPVLE